MTDQPKDPYAPEDDHDRRGVAGDGSPHGADAADEPTAHLDPQDPAPEPAGSEVLGADELQHDDARSDQRGQGQQPSHDPHHGQPPYGQQYGQRYGQQSLYGDASAGQQYDQPQQGQPSGAAGYGQHYTQARYGSMPQHGNDRYGGEYGRDQYNEGQYYQGPYGQGPYGQGPYGQGPYGQPAWGGSAGHQQYDPSIRPGSAGGDGGPGQPGGFFGALLDFRFNRFVTPTITRAVYALLAVFIVLWYLVIAVAAFDADVAFGVLWLLVIGPITVLVAFAMTRMMLELYLSVVRVGQDVRDIKERESGGTPPADGRST